MMEDNKEKLMFNMDDKDLVIISVTIMGICALFTLADPTTVLSSIIAGLFGIAVGRKN